MRVRVRLMQRLLRRRLAHTLHVLEGDSPHLLLGALALDLHVRGARIRVVGEGEVAPTRG